MQRIARALALLVVAALSLGGTFTAVATAGQAGGSSSPGEALATLKVEETKVEVKKKDAEKFKTAKDGQKLREGDTIRTDATGRAEIDYSDDAYTRLDVNTTLTITKLTDEEGARQVESNLDAGRAWNRTEAVTESGSFEQSGAGATAAVAGTAFMTTRISPTEISFLTAFHTVIVTNGIGDVRVVPFRGECVATQSEPADDAALCSEVRILTIDELAAIDFLQEMLKRDFLEHGYGPGPFLIPVQGVLNVEQGQVTSFAIIPQPTTTTTTTTTTTNTSNPNPLPPPAPPVIDPNPVNVTSLGASDPDVTGGTTGPHTSVVTEDEVGSLVTFVLQATNPDGSAFYLIFTDLPDPRVGTLYVGASGTVLVDLVEHYAPTTVFRFDPVEIEPVCSGSEPEFLDCYTNGNPSEGPDATAGTVPYPAPPSDTGNLSVSWSDTFTFKAVDESSGVESAPATVPIVVYDDICNEGSERAACDVLDHGSFAAEAPPESEGPPAEPDVPEEPEPSPDEG
jgi:hypothetical protein